MRIQLENVGVIRSCDIEFVPGINLIIGSSGSGKSTLMRSIYNLALNEFSDSDISFGKNSMSIKVNNNGNDIEYIRSIRSKSDRFYYIVNNEKYVKVGRQALPAVTDTLRIGDIDINGESVNFNFNLQFSSPFLILGNQATLYNVLTYRSSFDLSSINDLYSTDLKSNNSEINANIKLKERLESNLETLEDKATKLAPIEQIYSRYTSYKHTQNIANELMGLLAKLGFYNEVIQKCDLLNDTISHLLSARKKSETLIELAKYNSVKAAYNDIESSLDQTESLISTHRSAIMNIQKLIELIKASTIVSQIKSLECRLISINERVNSCKLVLCKDSFIKDVITAYSLLCNSTKVNSIVSILNRLDENIISNLDELITTSRKLEAVAVMNKYISDVNEKAKAIEAQLNHFEVCPLCGNTLNHNSSFTF